VYTLHSTLIEVSQPAIPLMSLQVQSKMVRSGKRSLTVWALKRLHSCVFSHVSGEFVRSCKFPTTPLPATLVWLFFCVCSLVSLEMGALCVDLVTSHL